MRSIVVILTLICSFQELWGQAIPLFTPGRDMTYTKRNTLEEDSAYFFVRITEVVDEADGTAYYFNVNIDTATSGCQTDTSFMGQKVLLLDDIYQTYVFFNDQQDSIFLRTDIELDDSWTYYTFPDGRFIRAQANNKIFKPIMPGVDDTIVRIKLSVFDASSNPLDIWPDNMKFDLSEQYGLAELYDFFHFPNEEELILLRGVSGPDTAITDVTARSAHEIAPGYEMHYDLQFSDDGNFDLHRLYKYFVLDTARFSDHVSITTQRTLWQELTQSGMPDTILLLDTIILDLEYNSFVLLDTPELHWMETPENGFLFSDFLLSPDLYSGIRHKWVYGGFSLVTEDPLCAEPGGSDPQWPVHLYGHGLGVMVAMDSAYEQLIPDPASTDLEFGWRDLQMVYFQQGLVTWGVPIDFYELGFTALEDPSDLAFNLFPNPATDRMTISGIDRADLLKIWSPDGRLVYTTTFTSALDVSFLVPGIYLLQIIAEDGTGVVTFIKN